MKVRDLREALDALGPEYDDSMVIVSQPGMSGPCEATQLITIPCLSNLDSRYSFEEFERVVWLCEGGPHVSRDAEAEGWEVPYYNATQATPRKVQS